MRTFLTTALVILAVFVIVPSVAQAITCTVGVDCPTSGSCQAACYFSCGVIFPASNIAATGGGNDIITGTSGADCICAGKGNDTVNAGDGDDCILGGFGADTINAGGGSDTVEGGWGEDCVDGGPGDDFLSGSHCDDVLFGGDDTDTCSGSSGLDTIICETADQGPATSEENAPRCPDCVFD